MAKYQVYLQVRTKDIWSNLAEEGASDEEIEKIIRTHGLGGDSSYVDLEFDTETGKVKFLGF